MKKAFLFAAGLLMVSSAIDAQNTISTIAGTGIYCCAGDGGPATGAQINYGVTVRGDAAGNIYIVDNYDLRVRKIDAATGIIHTIAGNGTNGFSGDGGPATDAMIKQGYLCVDAAGNVLLTGANRIRKIDAVTGIIHTIAGTGASGYTGDGGDATAATFRNPAGIFADASGNIYVCDLNNNVVRKIDGATNIITTIAGNGSAVFSGDGGQATTAGLSPEAVCLDNSGNIYIVSDSRVRKVDAATGIISTFAGIGSSATSPSGDGGPATAANVWASDISLGTDGLYIADWNRDNIRKVDASGIISTIAGNAGGGFAGDGGPATSSRLKGPLSLYCDGTGSVFIADNSNYRIRKIDLAGTISTFAGTGFFSFYGDGSAATNAQLNTPSYLCTDVSGNTFISEASNHRIRRMDGSGTITTVAGSGPTASNYEGGYSGDLEPATDARLKLPAGICTDGSGNLYIADNGNNRIRKVVAATGVITTIAGNGSPAFSGDGGPAVAAGINHPVAVGIDTKGNLYFSEQYRIRKVDAVTGIISTIAGDGVKSNCGDGGSPLDAHVGDVYDICFGPDGDLYFSDAWYNVVRRISMPEMDAITTVAGNGHVVKQEIDYGDYDYSGGYSGDYGSAINAELNHPAGIYMDNSNRLYIADYHSNVVRYVTPEGRIYTIAGSAYGALTYPHSTFFTGSFTGDGGPSKEATLFGPSDICLDNYGNLMIADAYNHRIRKVTSPVKVADGHRPTGVKIYPNPSGGKFSVSTGTDIADANVEICNITGQKIYSAQTSNHLLEIDLSAWPSGIYLVSVKTPMEMVFDKMVVQH